MSCSQQQAKKDELETEIVRGFCLGNLKECNEVLPCWLFKKKEKGKKRSKVKYWNLWLTKTDYIDQKVLALTAKNFFELLRNV